MDIREVPLADIIKMHERIPEFATQFPYTIETFRERTEGKKVLAIIAFIDGEAAGYVVGYDRDGDGSFYCWMAGVDPNHRRKGILSALMDYQREWAKKQGFKVLKIKTRNNRREMLGFLVKSGFHFMEVTPHDHINDHRIHLQSDL